VPAICSENRPDRVHLRQFDKLLRRQMTVLASGLMSMGELAVYFIPQLHSVFVLAGRAALRDR
jgi:hypothetical protein